MFLNAPMIAGVAAMLLPLVLHFAERWRIQSMRWGAMIFVEDRSPVSGLFRREWWVLGCRMAALALLAVALARPVRSMFASANGAGCTVLIIDRSGSMSMEEDGISRLESARRTALDALSNLPAGDEAAVVFMPEAQGPVFSDDLQRVAARINDTRPATGRADVAAALSTAERLLRSRHAGRNNVVIIGDRQAASWREVNDSFLTGWKQNLTGIESASLIFVPVGSAAISNCAILSAEPVASAQDDPFEAVIDIRIGNYSAVSRDHLRLEIAEASQLLLQMPVTIRANSVTAQRCRVHLRDPGSHLLSLRIESDSYPSDDVLNAAVTVGATIAGRPIVNQNLQVGELFVAELANAIGTKATIEGPSGISDLELNELPQGRQVRYAATNRTGSYRIKYSTAQGPAALDFVVRSLREESDVTPIDQITLQKLEQGLGMRVVNDPEPQKLSTLLKPNGNEAWTFLLPISLSLFMLEMVLSRRGAT